MDVKSNPESTSRIDEQVLLGALRSRQLAADDINELFALIQSHKNQHSFINVQIELYLNKQDYVQAFKCLL